MAGSARSYQQAAKMLGTNPYTLQRLIRELGIEPKPYSPTGHPPRFYPYSYSIDAQSMARLAVALKESKRWKTKPEPIMDTQGV